MCKYAQIANLLFCHVWLKGWRKKLKKSMINIFNCHSVFSLHKYVFYCSWSYTDLWNVLKNAIYAIIHCKYTNWTSLSLKSLHFHPIVEICMIVAYLCVGFENLLYILNSCALIARQMSYKMCMLYIFIVAVAVKCSCRNVPLHVFDCCRLGGRKKLQHPLSTSSDAPWFQPIIAHCPTCRFVRSSWDVVLGFLWARGGIV